MKSPQFEVDTREVQKHYDRLSRFYRMLWGEHLHHGYWENGESIERAQIKLMERLAEKAQIARGAHVLDIGCGIGGSALWLADHVRVSRYRTHDQSRPGKDGDEKGGIKRIGQPCEVRGH